MWHKLRVKGDRHRKVQKYNMQNIMDQLFHRYLLLNNNDKFYIFVHTINCFLKSNNHSVRHILLNTLHLIYHNYRLIIIQTVAIIKLFAYYVKIRGDTYYCKSCIMLQSEHYSNYTNLFYQY